MVVYNLNSNVENMDRRFNSDGDLMTNLQSPKIFFKSNVPHAFKLHKQTTFLEPIFFKAITSNFQALFKENWQFSRQIEKSSTFQDSIQIQALFKVCGNHENSSENFKLTKVDSLGHFPSGYWQ